MVVKGLPFRARHGARTNDFRLLPDARCTLASASRSPNFRSGPSHASSQPKAAESMAPRPPGKGLPLQRKFVSEFPRANGNWFPFGWLNATKVTAGPYYLMANFWLLERGAHSHPIRGCKRSIKRVKCSESEGNTCWFVSHGFKY